MVVGRDHDHPFARGELADEAQHRLDLDEVEVRGRFVGEHQRRIERDRARDGDALLLAAAQVARPVRHAVLQADLGEQLGGAFLRPAPGGPGRAQRHHHVLQRGQARNEVERLEHDADGVAAVRGHRLAVEAGDDTIAEGDLARRRAEDAAETREQRRLPAPARAEQDDERSPRGRRGRVRRSGAPRSRHSSTRRRGRGCSRSGTLRTSERERGIDGDRAPQARDAREQADDDRDHGQQRGTRSRERRRASGTSVPSTNDSTRRAARPQAATIIACSASPAMTDARRHADRLEHREVAHAFERGQVDHGADDQRGDDPEQHREEA